MTTTTTTPRSIFSCWHPGSREGQVAREIWSAAYGSDYPDDADPMSFVTLTDLKWISEALRVAPGNIVGDLGCGRGGPGIWVAQRIGTRLVGVDISEEAIEHASRRAAHGELQGRVSFQVGSFAATGIASASMDALMSVDALFFAPSRLAAFREAARILKPDGVFAFTSFELQRPSLSLSVDTIADYRPFLELTGFHVERYDEAEDWEPRMRKVFDGIMARSSELRAEAGEDVANRLVRWATVRSRELTEGRRILVVARRRA